MITSDNCPCCGEPVFIASYHPSDRSGNCDRCGARWIVDLKIGRDRVVRGRSVRWPTPIIAHRKRHEDGRLWMGRRDRPTFKAPSKPMRIDWATTPDVTVTINGEVADEATLDALYRELAGPPVVITGEGWDFIGYV